MQVPFVDLGLQYKSIQPEIDDAVKNVFTKSQFIGGTFVKNFEDSFAQAYAMNHCIGTGNGTDSLFVILKGLGINAGDEVITPAFSCIASAEVISLTGAKPVFVDVDNDYYTISLAEVEKKITSKTKAVIAVHLYGQAAPVFELKKICDKHNLSLIEDCAQAHFTKENSKLAGAFGIASAFSFYPTKNLGAYGDAGCILTNDNKLAEKFRRITNHGALQKDDHEIAGFNSRLDAMQASILSAKMNHILDWNAKRNQIAQLYNEHFRKSTEIILPVVRKNTEHIFHIYSIRSKKRDDLKAFLASKGIETLVHYPSGLPYTKTFQTLKHSLADFPITTQLQNELLSLPVYPELTDDQVNYVAENVNYFHSA